MIGETRMTSEKDNFTELFSKVTGKVIGEFKDKPKELAKILNEHKNLKKTFRMAVKEAKGPEPTEEDSTAMGLASLFPA